MITFEQTGLRPEILQAISEMGFETPTPIQQKTIPHLLSEDSDVIALAQTGTGKTAAFGLPLVQLIDPEEDGIQALVLCPTRELCIQITRDLADFSKHLAEFETVAVYGGSSIEKQIRAIKAGAQIIIGTPGRVIDLINRRVLDFSGVKYLVLDEADEMLNRGFREDLDTILETTPPDKQTLLFSATMPDHVARISRTYLNNPQQFAVARTNEGAANVVHQYFIVGNRNRYAALRRLVDYHPGIYGIVFCRTRAETQEVADNLLRDGYNSEALHGDLSQAQRDQVMNRFRKGRLSLLVATDVAARGLDVDDLTHVINFNLPDDPEVYIHRSGRTGRAGKEGVCFSLITPGEMYRINRVQKMAKRQFEKGEIPSGEIVCAKQLFHKLDELQSTEPDMEMLKPYLDDVYEQFEDMEKEELLRKLVSFDLGKILEAYKNAPDLNASEKDKSSNSSKDRYADDPDWATFQLNMGSKRHLNASRLIGLINELTGDPSIKIGKVRVLQKDSWFEIDPAHRNTLTDAFAGIHVNGYGLKIYEVDGMPMNKQFNGPEKKKFRSGYRKKKNFRGRR